MILSGIWLVSLGAGAIALPRIVPDDTLGTEVQRFGNESRISHNEQAQRVHNLFHSFRDFSIPRNHTVYFEHDPDVATIFARVTGDRRSFIRGVLGVDGTADLFLINPNGIIFGKDAALDLNGSFVATTAEATEFADGLSFTTLGVDHSLQQANTPLSLSVPIGLQFGSNPGPIINVSRHARMKFENLFPSSISGGLQVSEGESLLLMGGALTMENGWITAPLGHIELGSVGSNSQVAIDSRQQGFDVVYDGSQTFQNIQLSRANIIAHGIQLLDDGGVRLRENGAGTIQIRGQHLILSQRTNLLTSGQRQSGIQLTGNTIQLSGGSIVESKTKNRNGGDIALRASGRILIDGGSEIAAITRSGGTGNGGNLTIQAHHLQVNDVSTIVTTTSGSGQAGNVRVNVQDTVSFRGRDGRGGILARAEGSTGDGGTIRINSRHLIVQDGAAITATTFSNGRAGNVEISASESIVVSGQEGSSSDSVPALLASQSIDFGQVNDGGDAGLIDIRTPYLHVNDGAEITASTATTGQGGSIRIEADVIQVSGNNANLRTAATGRGDAGRLRIVARSLEVSNGGELTVEGTAQGSAGNLRINADVVTLDRGNLLATTQSGSGASITLNNVDRLLMQNSSLISARAEQRANGGNVRINAPDGFIVGEFQENNQILASADQGKGGLIEINAADVIGFVERTPNDILNVLDASSRLNDDGVVTINTPTTDPENDVVELPSATVNVATLVDDTVCRATQGSEFIEVGRGGVPPASGESLHSQGIWEDWRLARVNESPGPMRSQRIATQTEDQTFETLFSGDNARGGSVRVGNGDRPAAITEAQHWIVNADGNIELIADYPTASMAVQPHSSCP